MLNKRLEQPVLRGALAGACALFTLVCAGNAKWIVPYRTFSLFLLIGLAVFNYKVLPLLQGRRAVFSLCGGFVFALCQATAEVMQAVTPLVDILYLTVGFFFLYTALLCGALFFLEGWESRGPADSSPESPADPPLLFGRVQHFFRWLLSGQRKANLALFGLVCLFWLPFYIVFFPGLATWDTADQLYGVLIGDTLLAHHPPVHSFWMAGCLQVGRTLFGTYAAGVALATLMQLMLMALLIGFALSVMRRLGLCLGWRVAVLLFYMLSPIYGWYAVTLWKDVWLGCFCFLLALCCAELAQARAAYFRSPARVAVLALAVLGVLVSKNNGVYIFIITALACLIFLPGVRRQMAAVLVLGMVASQLITGPFYSALGIQKGSVREALSIPLLQVANVVRAAPETISAEDEALLTALLPYYSELGERYDPQISDSVKDGFVDEAFAANKGAYMSLYLRLGAAHPKLYLRAALEHTYAYFFPDSVYGAMAITTYPTFINENADVFDAMDPMAGHYVQPLYRLTERVRTGIGFEHTIPGLSRLFAPGPYFWGLLFGGLYAWYKKRQLRLVALAMPFAVWLTCLASPVNGSLRYSFAAVMAFPFLMALLLCADTPPPEEQPGPETLQRKEAAT